MGEIYPGMFVRRPSRSFGPCFNLARSPSIQSNTSTHSPSAIPKDTRRPVQPRCSGMSVVDFTAPFASAMVNASAEAPAQTERPVASITWHIVQTHGTDMLHRWREAPMTNIKLTINQITPSRSNGQADRAKAPKNPPGPVAPAAAVACASAASERLLTRCRAPAITSIHARYAIPANDSANPTSVRVVLRTRPSIDTLDHFREIRSKKSSSGESTTLKIACRNFTRCL